MKRKREHCSHPRGTLGIRLVYVVYPCPAAPFPTLLGCRYLDICLVAAGVRCAVLLDTRRAPRGSPPLGDVLEALQQDQKHGHHNHQPQHRQQHGRGEDGGDCTIISSCDVACLGVLDLGGSLLLVNRALLQRRLEEFFSIESLAESSCSWGVPGDTTEKHVAGAAAAAAAAVGPSSEQTSHAAPPASSGGGGGGTGAQRQRHGRRTFALVDVRKSLALPCERSDVLAPRLDAALRSAFGGVAGTGADRPPPRGVPFNIHGASTAVDAAAMGDRADRHSDDGDLCLAATHGEEAGAGARWLRDWGTKELVLDCQGLRRTLGGVGLCGLAGWLLGYPVVYCCPQVESHDGDTADRAGDAGGTTAEQAVGNCLAAVPLTVYSVSVDLGNEKGSGSSCHVPRDAPAGTTGMPSQAFSFSVPERVCCSVDAAEGEEGIDTCAGLQGLVDGFFGRLEARIARHRSSSSSSAGYSSFGGHEQLVCGLTVSRRTETLDRVAL